MFLCIEAQYLFALVSSVRPRVALLYKHRLPPLKIEDIGKILKANRKRSRRGEIVSSVEHVREVTFSLPLTTFLAVRSKNVLKLKGNSYNV